MIIEEMYTNLVTHRMSLDVSLSLFDSKPKTWKAETPLKMVFDDTNQMPYIYEEEIEKINLKTMIKQMIPHFNIKKDLVNTYNPNKSSNFILFRENMWSLFLSTIPIATFLDFAQTVKEKKEKKIVLLQKNIYTIIWIENIYLSLVQLQKQKEAEKISYIRTNCDRNYYKLSKTHFDDLIENTKNYFMCDNLSDINITFKTFNGKNFSEFIKDDDKLVIHIQFFLKCRIFPDMIDKNSTTSSPKVEIPNVIIMDMPDTSMEEEINDLFLKEKNH
jgi:hypothetical protein